MCHDQFRHRKLDSRHILLFFSEHSRVILKLDQNKKKTDFIFVATETKISDLKLENLCISVAQVDTHLQFFLIIEAETLKWSFMIY